MADESVKDMDYYTKKILEDLLLNAVSTGKQQLYLKEVNRVTDASVYRNLSSATTVTNFKTIIPKGKYIWDKDDSDVFMGYCSKCDRIVIRRGGWYKDSDHCSECELKSTMVGCMPF